MADKKTKVAVYGSLRKGLSNHRFLENADFLGSFETAPKYSMYSVNLMYPALKLYGTTSIKMEVYEVTKEELSKINTLEGYREGRPRDHNHYDRFTTKTPYGEAYCYEYVPSVNTLYPVESGDWTNFKQNHEVLNN